MHKEGVAHIHNRLLFSHNKERNDAICSNMDATKDFPTKWSKPEGERQIPYDITYMWNLKYDTNKLICEIETNSQTEQTCGYQRGGGGVGMDWELGINRSDLLYRE